jgi:hypothetical protein
MLLVFCALVAACGGSSGISKADYAKRADAICRRYQARLGTLTPARTPREIVAALKALPVPKSERDLVARWLARGDRAIAALVDLRRAASHGATLAVRDIVAAAEENAAAADRLARELGLRACSL